MKINKIYVYTLKDYYDGPNDLHAFVPDILNEYIVVTIQDDGWFGVKLNLKGLWIIYLDQLNLLDKIDDYDNNSTTGYNL